MNERDDFLNLDRQIDRLVDGELSGDEYREVLMLVDEEEDGWRRCATAFLEAQAFGQEFQSVRAIVDAPGPRIHRAAAFGRSAIFLVA